MDELISLCSPGAHFEDTELERLKLVDSIKAYKSKAVSWGLAFGWKEREEREGKRGKFHRITEVGKGL